MAPIIGPLLDRFRHGRRWAIALTLLVRAFLAWVLAGAVDSEDFSLYPAAFGCLVASKAYGVTRSATVPRLLPEGGTLVAANSRISLAGIVSGAHRRRRRRRHLVASRWRGRCGSPSSSSASGTVLALRLPARVDSTDGETPTTLSLDDTGPIPRRTSVGNAVVIALRANGALRAFSGFLTLFFAFLLREHPIGGLRRRPSRSGWSRRRQAIGSTVGTTIGSRLRARPDFVIVVVLTILTAAALAGALHLRRRDRRGGRRRGRARPVAGQAVAGRDRAARRARGRADLGVRPVRDGAAAVLGRRRRPSASRCRSTAGWG